MGDPFGGEIGFDLPLNINNTGFQAVPDWRIRSAIVIDSEGKKAKCPIFLTAITVYFFIKQ